MTKKTVLALLLIVGLLIVGASAYAYGPGYGRGCGGYGQGFGQGGADDKFRQDNAQLLADLYQKNLEMRALWAAAQVDEGKAKALQAEINKLQNDLAEKRLAAELEFRKNNPDLRPGFGPGYGRGNGPGNCWR
jgi:UDP-glucose 6-dehydrogenase